MANSIGLEIGKTYVAKYPFVRDEVELFDADEPYKKISWRPGCHIDQDGGYGYRTMFAHSHGEILLTVVSVHKPGKYPVRIFYIRQWRDPDGLVFGKRKLRITTAGNFRRLSKGYRHQYDLDESG